MAQKPAPKKTGNTAGKQTENKGFTIKGDAEKKAYLDQFSKEKGLTIGEAFNNVVEFHEKNHLLTNEKDETIERLRRLVNSGEESIGKLTQENTSLREEIDSLTYKQLDSQAEISSLKNAMKNTVDVSNISFLNAAREVVNKNAGRTSENSVTDFEVIEIALELFVKEMLPEG